MRIFEKEEIEKLLSYPVCISLMKDCFKELELGEIKQPVRSGIGLAKGGLAYMPCSMEKRGSFGAKIISVYPGNAAQGYPSHQGYVLLFEEEHGAAVSMADAVAITEIRTAAASAAATDLLANEDSHVLAILGSGAQARTHLAAMCAVRKIDQVFVWSHTNEHAIRFAQDMQKIYDFPITVCDTAKEAVKNADIICTVSRANEPILEADWVKSGVHINAVGTCNPAKRELSSALIAKGLLYADQVEACLAESGDYLLPLKEGVISKEHLLGSIGELILGKCRGRESKDEITIFDSLGLAAEDVICADYLYRNHK